MTKLDAKGQPHPDEPVRELQCGSSPSAEREGSGCGAAAERPAEAQPLPGQRWFGLAIHALVVLANDGGCCPSLTIGRRLNTEPTLLRKIMARLAQAGIVETREGRDGGYRLAQPPDRLTLADVHRALRCESAPYSSLRCTAGIRPDASGLAAALSAVADKLDEAVLDVLGSCTIAEMAAAASEAGS